MAESAIPRPEREHGMPFGEEPLPHICRRSGTKVERGNIERKRNLGNAHLDVLMENIDVNLKLLDVLLLVGFVSVVACVGGMYLSLRTRDARTIAIAVSLVAIAVLLFVSQYTDYYVGNTSLYYQGESNKAAQERIRLDRLLEGLLKRE